MSLATHLYLSTWVVSRTGYCDKHRNAERFFFLHVDFGFLGHIPKFLLLDHMEALFELFGGIYVLFSIKAGPVYIPSRYSGCLVCCLCVSLEGKMLGSWSGTMFMTLCPDSKIAPV